MINEIHLHTDIEILEGNFKSKHGVPIIVDVNRLFGYFLQGANIVKVAYSREDAEGIIKHYKGATIEPIYYYCA